ncbi:conserved Plasmodium protein, unknown function [Plasmodium knowlesi strain H]|uniref:Chloroquine resistance marker protein n=3 Tax=Plasmodium knowlesi TaxID=5850 RepID=A0A5E7X725_PLAKH|nr:conserved Plasmodium protein, unknown function [Plasmodium knowlesi strain H]OTN65589.1 Uncharacterized protein PKNOH_S110104500 [Plasmodium knowlesi]CAA9989664.1 conserved Plasmodium protein, unknown function [Plasmodium knowlesi strain H]SBO22786.1 conserved Plasmodium protein, unknown function [Plasmodium knowlesi strain H]SBO23116.1 conserved Plasmodium protein, unknown function [Plasmodium knowlesi strain H]VVS79138.1 conserved Plasmodium protein, unknown function [Plasmodium knowlesi 
MERETSKCNDSPGGSWPQQGRSISAKNPARSQTKKTEKDSPIIFEHEKERNKSLRNYYKKIEKYGNRKNGFGQNKEEVIDVDFQKGTTLKMGNPWNSVEAKTMNGNHINIDKVRRDHTIYNSIGDMYRAVYEHKYPKGRHPLVFSRHVSVPNMVMNDSNHLIGTNEKSRRLCYNSNLCFSRHFFKGGNTNLNLSRGYTNWGERTKRILPHRDRFMWREPVVDGVPTNSANIINGAGRIRDENHHTVLCQVDSPRMNTCGASSNAVSCRAGVPRSIYGIHHADHADVDDNGTDVNFFFQKFLRESRARRSHFAQMKEEQQRERGCAQRMEGNTHCVVTAHPLRTTHPSSRGDILDLKMRGTMANHVVDMDPSPFAPMHRDIQQKTRLQCCAKRLLNKHANEEAFHIMEKKTHDKNMGMLDCQNRICTPLRISPHFAYVESAHIRKDTLGTNKIIVFPTRNKRRKVEMNDTSHRKQCDEHPIISDLCKGCYEGREFPLREEGNIRKKVEMERHLRAHPSLGSFHVVNQNVHDNYLGIQVQMENGREKMQCGKNKCTVRWSPPAMPGGEVASPSKWDHQTEDNRKGTDVYCDRINNQNEGCKKNVHLGKIVQNWRDKLPAVSEILPKHNKEETNEDECSLVRKETEKTLKGDNKFYQNCGLFRNFVFSFKNPHRGGEKEGKSEKGAEAEKGEKIDKGATMEKTPKKYKKMKNEKHSLPSSQAQYKKFEEKYFSEDQISSDFQWREVDGTISSHAQDFLFFDEEDLQMVSLDVLDHSAVSISSSGSSDDTSGGKPCHFSRKGRNQVRQSRNDGEHNNTLLKNQQEKLTSQNEQKIYTKERNNKIERNNSSTHKRDASHGSHPSSADTVTNRGNVKQVTNGEKYHHGVRQGEKAQGKKNKYVIMYAKIMNISYEYGADVLKQFSHPAVNLFNTNKTHIVKKKEKNRREVYAYIDGEEEFGAVHQVGHSVKHAVEKKMTDEMVEKMAQEMAEELVHELGTPGEKRKRKYTKKQEDPETKKKKFISHKIKRHLLCINARIVIKEWYIDYGTSASITPYIYVVSENDNRYKLDRVHDKYYSTFTNVRLKFEVTTRIVKSLQAYPNITYKELVGHLTLYECISKKMRKAKEGLIEREDLMSPTWNQRTNRGGKPKRKKKKQEKQETKYGMTGERCPWDSCGEDDLASWRIHPNDCYPLLDEELSKMEEPCEKKKKEKKRKEKKKKEEPPIVSVSLSEYSGTGVHTMPDGTISKKCTWGAPYAVYKCNSKVIIRLYKFIKNEMKILTQGFNVKCLLCTPFMKILAQKFKFENKKNQQMKKLTRVCSLSVNNQVCSDALLDCHENGELDSSAKKMARFYLIRSFVERQKGNADKYESSCGCTEQAKTEEKEELGRQHVPLGAGEIDLSSVCPHGGRTTQRESPASVEKNTLGCHNQERQSAEGENHTTKNESKYALKSSFEGMQVPTKYCTCDTPREISSPLDLINPLKHESVLKIWVFLWTYKQMTDSKITVSQLNEELVQRKSTFSKEMTGQIILQRILSNEQLYKSENLVSGLQNICGEKKHITLDGVTSGQRHNSCIDEMMRVILLVLYRSLRIDRNRRSCSMVNKQNGTFRNVGSGTNPSSYDIFDHLEDPTLCEILNFPIMKFFTRGERKRRSENNISGEEKIFPWNGSRDNEGMKGKDPPKENSQTEQKNNRTCSTRGKVIEGEYSPEEDKEEKKECAHMNNTDEDIQAIRKNNNHKTIIRSDDHPLNLILYKRDVKNNSYGKILLDVLTERNEKKKLFDLCGDMRLLDHLTWPLYLKKCLFMLLYVMNHSFLVEYDDREESEEEDSSELTPNGQNYPSGEMNLSCRRCVSSIDNDNYDENEKIERKTISECCRELQDVKMKRYILSWVPNEDDNFDRETSCRNDMLAILDFLCEENATFEMLSTNQKMDLLSFFINAIKCSTVERERENGEEEHLKKVNRSVALEKNMEGTSRSALNKIPSTDIPTNGTPSNGKSEVNKEREDIRSNHSDEERSYVEEVGKYFNVKVHLLGKDRHCNKYYIFGEILGCTDCIYVESVNECGPVHEPPPNESPDRIKNPHEEGHITSTPNNHFPGDLNPPKGRTQIGYIEGVDNITRFVELFSPSSVEETELKRKLVQLKKALVTTCQVVQVENPSEESASMKNPTNGNIYIEGEKKNSNRGSSRGENQSAQEEVNLSTNIQYKNCKKCREVRKQEKRKEVAEQGDKCPIVKENIGNKHRDVYRSGEGESQKNIRKSPSDSEKIMLDQILCVMEKLLYFVKKTKMVLNECIQEKFGKLVDNFILMTIRIFVKDKLRNNLSLIFIDFVDVMENIETFFFQHPYCFFLKKRWRKELRKLWENDMQFLKCLFRRGLKDINVLDVVPTLCFYFNYFVTYGLKEKAIHMYRKYGLTGMVSELEDLGGGATTAQRKLQTLRKVRSMLKGSLGVAAKGSREDIQGDTEVCPENCFQDENISDVLSDICELLPYKVDGRYIYFKEGHLKHMEILFNKNLFFSEGNNLEKINTTEIVEVRDIKMFLIPKGDLWKLGNWKEGASSGENVECTQNGNPKEMSTDLSEIIRTDQTKENGLGEEAQTRYSLNGKEELSNETNRSATYHTDYYILREGLLKIKEAVERKKWGPPNKYNTLYLKPMEQYTKVLEAQMCSSFLSPNFGTFVDVKSEVMREVGTGENKIRGAPSVHCKKQEETFVYVCQLHCVIYPRDDLEEGSEEYMRQIQEPYVLCERYIYAQWKFLTLNLCFTENMHTIFYIFPLSRSALSSPCWSTPMCTQGWMTEGTSNAE